MTNPPSPSSLVGPRLANTVPSQLPSDCASHFVFRLELLMLDVVGQYPVRPVTYTLLLDVALGRLESARS